MQRYFSKGLSNNYFTLEDTDIRHIRLVMRMNDGDNIEVVYDGKVYLCCLENVKENIRIKLQKELKSDVKSMRKITLIIPVLKEQKMDLILQKSTELGVDRIIPVLTERSIIKVDEASGVKKVERWKKILKEASEQSMRNYIPEISPVIKLDNLKNIDGLNLICSTVENKNNIKKVLQEYNKCDKINIVIGPEGGLSEKEEIKLVEKGFKRVTLGSRILRVETVPLFLLSIINYEFME